MNIWVINRDDRPERLSYFTEEIKRVGINSRRFSAVIDKPGWRGCRDSHIALLEKVRENKVGLILEDDVKFLVHKDDLWAEVDKAFDDAVTLVGADVDCIFLGCSPQEPFVRLSDNLFRMGKSFTTHAILWYYRQGGAIDYILENRARINKIDVFFNDEVYPKFNCFCTAKLLATQIQFQSDTCLRSDVSTIEKNFKKHCI